jgi:hypothetical protein
MEETKTIVTFHTLLSLFLTDRRTCKIHGIQASVTDMSVRTDNLHTNQPFPIPIPKIRKRYCIKLFGGQSQSVHGGDSFNKWNDSYFSHASFLLIYLTEGPAKYIKIMNQLLTCPCKTAHITYIPINHFQLHFRKEGRGTVLNCSGVNRKV